MSADLRLTSYSAGRRDITSAQQGCQLLSEYLGSYFQATSFVEDWQRGGLLLVLEEDGRVIAAAFISPASVDKWQKFSRYVSLPPGRKTANLNGLAVVPEKRGQGYGWLLTAKRLQLALSAGYQLLLAESWSESAAPSTPVLRRAGLQQLAVVDNFWHKEYSQPGTCPRCGDYCYCTARLFAAILAPYRR